MDLRIRTGSAAEASALQAQIPELLPAYPLSVYEARLAGPRSLVLIAEADGLPAAFKCGYEREPGTSWWYSWMGGVLPAYRRLGLAARLADAQEAQLRAWGIGRVRFKTRNSHQAMLMFAIGRGYQILSVEPRELVAEHRVWLEKVL
jgi:GNAT superfamily N-acetyltransferase